MKIFFQLFVLCFIILIACILVSSDEECQISENPSNVAYTITVSQSGSGNFKTITDAVNSIPPKNNKWIKIFLESGVYNEHVYVKDKDCIFLEGSDSATTIISFDVAHDPSGSYVFDLSANNFVAMGITFKNTHNRLLEERDPMHDIIPAVALKAVGDKHAFYNCGFIGYQDTLLDQQGRHYFKSCYIEGAVDFIWGNAQSVYEECTLNITGNGHITAQARERAEDTNGYVFRGCNVVGTARAHLGRAYRSHSRVIFIDSFFNDVILPEGWDIWQQQGHENDITYAEVNCKGPGANNPGRVPWMKHLDGSEVEQYTTQAFIDQEGWIAKQPH